jgi:hypothetical protein
MVDHAWGPYLACMCGSAFVLRGVVVKLLSP